nr:hypothetical protein [uncultured Propionibacterium sp.]
MTRTVLTATRALRASWMRVSFSGSSELVASSSRTIGSSLSRALAIEMRWRSPPDSFAPFSPSRLCQPSGSLSMKPSQ